MNSFTSEVGEYLLLFLVLTQKAIVSLPKA